MAHIRRLEQVSKTRHWRSKAWCTHVNPRFPRGYTRVVPDRQALSDAASKADSGPAGTGLYHQGAAVKRANMRTGLCGRAVRLDRETLACARRQRNLE
jgi:hypothetical protein